MLKADWRRASGGFRGQYECLQLRNHPYARCYQQCRTYFEQRPDSLKAVTGVDQLIPSPNRRLNRLNSTANRLTPLTRLTVLKGMLANVESYDKLLLNSVVSCVALCCAFPTRPIKVVKLSSA